MTCIIYNQNIDQEARGRQEQYQINKKLLNTKCRVRDICVTCIIYDNNIDQEDGGRQEQYQISAISHQYGIIDVEMSSS